MENRKVDKILIALDLDPISAKVAEVGFNLAKAKDAKVVLLHIKMQLVNYTLTYKEIELLQLERFEDMEFSALNFTDNSKNNYDENAIQTIVKEGDFAGCILDTAKDMNIDVIVMGSHSSKWVEETVMGRVTNRILQQSKIPLLIIPTNKNDKTNIFIA